RFQPDGRIRVRKITEGGTGTTSLTIRPVDARPPVVYQQQATTTRQGSPVLATGDDTSGLLIGFYDIQETSPSNSENWRLESVTCDGKPVGSAQGRIRIRLTGDDPTADCTFTNVKTSATETPGGGGGDNGGVEGETTK